MKTGKFCQETHNSNCNIKLNLVKHYDESIRCIKKENFNLKLKVFFLEERLSKGVNNSEVALINENAELKVIIIF